MLALLIREKKNLKLVWSSKYNWLADGPNCNCCPGKKYDRGQLDVRGIPYAYKRQSMPFSWCWKIFWSGFVHWRSIRSISVARASEKFLNGRPACDVLSNRRATSYTNFRDNSRFLGVQSVGIAKTSDCLLDDTMPRAACPSELMPASGFVISNPSV